MDAVSDVQRRDLHLLYVHHNTLRCAFTRCIACCYKIALHSRPGLLPNVRPELCPRMEATTDAAGDDQAGPAPSFQANKHCIGLYDARAVKKILTVGDGNFSYSLALARALGPDSGVELMATSHESRTSIVETYPDGEKILGELAVMSNVTVKHEVDATDAEQLKALGQFDRVIWNFPCIRAPQGKDGQNEEMERNKKLLHDFFRHVGHVLTATGEVHVTHKTKAPFSQWGIKNIATTNHLGYKRSVIFDRCLYPGYTNKKVLSKGSFPIWDSQTFVFVPEGQAQLPAEGEETGMPDDNGCPDMIEPVTVDILEKVYLLLTPSLDDMLGSKKKKRKKGCSGSKGATSNSNFKDVSSSRRDVTNQKRKQPASSRSKGNKHSGTKKSRRS
uniref:25S rRNA (uridine-N(3))-methyltransferase BMT5-like domain-containing protein n=1 Tax=Peronospora matthiolae TaxID=2874970 RepID=A0AAV1UI22_9STRA